LSAARAQGRGGCIAPGACRAYAANQQLSEAISAYRRAADRGLVGNGELGVLLATGQGVPKDEAQARKLLTWKRRDQPLLLAGAMVSANDKSAPRGATTCFDWRNGRHGLLRERPGRAALLDVIEVSYSRLRLAECMARTSDPLALQGVNRTKGAAHAAPFGF
jgi:hypothetical protein